jgi:hypothetical protein
MSGVFLANIGRAGLAFGGAVDASENAKSYTEPFERCRPLRLR